MTRQTYIEVYPTRRWPGFLAIVWCDTQRVQRVFFGRDREMVIFHAEFYAAQMETAAVGHRK